MVKLSDLSKDEFRRYQLKLLEMVSYFDQVCEENHLRYYLTCGSCLGAVRHQGFIPWDDDFDVAMPRRDYEKLWEIWNDKYSKNRYYLCRTTEDLCIHFQIMQLRDATTTFVYEHSKNLNICHGIKLDICPIDGCPSSRLALLKQSFYAQLFGLFAAQRVPNQASESKRMLAKVLLTVVPSNKVRSKIWKLAERKISQYDFETSKNVRCLEGRLRRKEVYGTPKRMPFEDRQLYIPEDYETYLQQEYGDYMKLPSENQRRPETEVAFFDLDHSYKDCLGMRS